jgi:hypothetical protein
MSIARLGSTVAGVFGAARPSAAAYQRRPQAFEAASFGAVTQQGRLASGSPLATPSRRGHRRQHSGPLGERFAWLLTLGPWPPGSESCWCAASSARATCEGTRTRSDPGSSLTAGEGGRMLAGESLQGRRGDAARFLRRADLGAPGAIVVSVLLEAFDET